jgi:integrase
VGEDGEALKVALAAGERQRDRVLSDDEIAKYLSACPQPWRDCATIILDEGFRPGEVFTLQWPAVFLNEDGKTGFIQIVDRKSKAARRMLPITPRVHALLRARWEAAGGDVFVLARIAGHSSITITQRYPARHGAPTECELWV